MQAGSIRTRTPSAQFSLATRTIRVARACACLAAIAAPATAPHRLTLAQQIALNQQVELNQAQPKQSIIDPAANRPPDKNDQMQMQEQAKRQASFDAANLARKKQLADDSQALLKLATELKEELDRTPKDTLSLAVVHKAEEIERLAHSVQVKMKLTVNARN